MEIIISIIMGISLSAACGFRVFVPLLGLSICSFLGLINLDSNFLWIGSSPALIMFSVATILEIGVYYIPWLDNLLDSITSPLSVIAGILVSVSVYVDMPPFIKWSLAVITGGSVAGVFQFGTASIRVLSSGTTVGFGNIIVSTFELIGSFVITLLAIFLPIICIIIIITMTTVILVRHKKRKKHRYPS